MIKGRWGDRVFGSVNWVTALRDDSGSVLDRGSFNLSGPVFPTFSVKTPGVIIEMNRGLMSVYVPGFPSPCLPAHPSASSVPPSIPPFRIHPSIHPYIHPACPSSVLVHLTFYQPVARRGCHVKAAALRVALWGEDDLVLSHCPYLLMSVWCGGQAAWGRRVDQLVHSLSDSPPSSTTSRSSP